MEAFWYVAAIFIWVALALIAVSLLGVVYYAYLWNASRKEERTEALKLLDGYELDLKRKGRHEKEE